MLSKDVGNITLKPVGPLARCSREIVYNLKQPAVEQFKLVTECDLYGGRNRNKKIALEKRRGVRVKLTEHDVVAVLANVSKDGRHPERLQTSTSVNKGAEADLVCKEFWEHLLLGERLLPAAVRTFSEIHSFIKSVCAERGQIGRIAER